eukprot:SAG31_NODE_9769_length_1230_cov_1.557029_1_plen_51_part_10
MISDTALVSPVFLQYIPGTALQESFVIDHDELTHRAYSPGSQVRRYFLVFV